MKLPISILMAGLLAASPLVFAADNVATDSSNSSITDKIKNSDSVINAKIVTIYTLNTQLNPFDVKVDVKDNVVTLTGSVQSSGEKDLAAELAKDVDGVKNVVNNIAVEKAAKRGNKPGFAQTVEDATTTAAVKSKLLANSNTSGLDIHVKTIKGTVTLTGIVKSKTEKQLAGKLAKNVGGVVKVANNLSTQ